MISPVYDFHIREGKKIIRTAPGLWYECPIISASVPEAHIVKCPKCRLINPDTALRCDCGYDFKSGKMEQPYQKTKAQIPLWIWVILYLLVIFSFFVVTGFLPLRDRPDASD